MLAGATQELLTACAVGIPKPSRDSMLAGAMQELLTACGAGIPKPSRDSKSFSKHVRQACQGFWLRVWQGPRKSFSQHQTNESKLAASFALSLTRPFCILQAALQPKTKASKADLASCCLPLLRKQLALSGNIWSHTTILRRQKI